MGYLALYRKYRPCDFSDLVGQSEVASIIKNEILNDKISHAYLFSGPRGTGKTSTAKIIAKMINCQSLTKDGVPCGKCVSCLNFDSSSDVVEIDAASNNGVDEIRDLRDKVNLVPTFGKYKVYIIDEVHMLTTQAFNALLKTIEEPPAHVVFILATTEFYKIPATIVSRCQKFQFLKFSIDDIVARLSDIASKESILVSKDALYEIARLSDGGMRDAINMLDQLSSFKDENLGIDDVYQLNGVISYTDFSDLLSLLKKRDVTSIVNFLEKIDQSGKSMDRFIGDFIYFIKDILVFKTTSGYLNTNIVEKDEILRSASDFFSIEQLYSFIISLNDLSVRVKNSSFPMILIVSEFIKLTNMSSNDKNIQKSVENNGFETVSFEENKLSDNEKKVIISNVEYNKINNNVNNITDREKKVRVNNTFATASKELKCNFINGWDNVKEKLSNDTNYFSIAGMMNDVQVMVVGDGYVIFMAEYDSLLERLYNQVDIIEKLLFEVYNIVYKVVFLLKDEWNYEKEKYVSSLKSGKKYELINDFSSVDASSDNGKNVDSDVEKIVSMLGNDVICYE